MTKIRQIKKCQFFQLQNIKISAIELHLRNKNEKLCIIV